MTSTRPSSSPTSPTQGRAGPLPAIEQALLAARFLRVCPRGGCKRAAQQLLVRRPEVRLAEASVPEHCEVCHGSAIGAEIDRMLASCAEAGWSRLCVVGGSPNARIALESELAGRPELRLVDGTRSRTRQQAKTDLA